MSWREIKVQFTKLTPAAFTPIKCSRDAAGYDLMSAYEYMVPGKGSCLIKTDIQISLPHGTYGRIAPRSSLALLHQIDVGAGVIDRDFRGNVSVFLFNHGAEDFIIKPGDRIAQLIVEKIENVSFEEVPALGETIRGSRGFGSSGRR